MSAIHATRPRHVTPLGYAWLAWGIILATIAGALVFQAAGIAPCELCLKERWPYYAGLALGLATIAVAWRTSRVATRAAFAAMALLFLGSAIFGTYHAGVEWGWWAGPSDCTGPLDHAGSVNDFLKQLQSVHVVRCDAVAIRILGLSLAGWNAVISLGVAAVALAGFLRASSPRDHSGELAARGAAR